MGKEDADQSKIDDDASTFSPQPELRALFQQTVSGGVSDHGNDE